MAKRDFGEALSKTVRAAALPTPEDRFSRADAFLDRGTAPIAPNAAPAAMAPAAPPPPAKTVIRDSFSFPEEDYALIASLQNRLLALRRMTTKSEILRAGLKALQGMGDDELVVAIERVERLKVGRKGTV
jgi:hypothetical protein